MSFQISFLIILTEAIKKGLNIIQKLHGYSVLKNHKNTIKIYNYLFISNLN
ncbi:hypothetical protein CHU_1884 [Cytophaga hutchinsonii ATCC 33406]|uniref:Uncharacterized protein n=1 Tax=Cytophaga hutchinsonii (strain ATCC 33406 / DSM 1761 / CIP 103989 / NBRC 15051 / NCIMB 9469 / D465) TaxID=269798 RepID=A0A6N4SS41_CYTH3|nr:hypothetical protein CHU_1884 [Cytophaga hutchinsonii ATCC 33406]